MRARLAAPLRASVRLPARGRPPTARGRRDAVRAAAEGDGAGAAVAATATSAPPPRTADPLTTTTSSSSSGIDGPPVAISEAASVGGPVDASVAVGGATLPPGALPALDAATSVSLPGAAAPPPSSPSSLPSSTTSTPARPAWRVLPPAVEGVLLLQTCAMLFGTNQVAVKTVEQSMSPALAAAVRFSLAAVVFAPAAVRGARDPAIRAAGTELGVWLAAGYGAQALGLAHSTAARGAFTGAFTIFTVPALAAGLGGRRIPPAVWALASLAIVGVGLITSADGPPPGPADAALVASALLFGVHKWRCEGATLSAVAREQQGAGGGSGDNDDAAAAGLTGVQLAVLAACAVASAAPELVTAAAHGRLAEALGPVSDHGLALAYVGVVTTGLTLRWEVEALKVVPAHTAALIYSSEMLWGAAGAWFLGGERWGVAGWIGAACVAAASVGAARMGAGGEGLEEEKVE